MKKILLTIENQFSHVFFEPLNTNLCAHSIAKILFTLFAFVNQLKLVNAYGLFKITWIAVIFQMNTKMCTIFHYSTTKKKQYTVLNTR